MRRLAIESLTVRGFRNLAGDEVTLGPGFNVVSGENGQGKTNLLEAIYVLATSRSFRTGRLSELLQHGVDTASVKARVKEDDESREHAVGLRPGSRQVRINGKRPATLAEYAVTTPVVVFHPGSLVLSTGSGLERRRLMDRLSLYRDPGSLGDADAYTKALRARQRVLDTRGESSRDLEHWEELIVRHGIALRTARETTFAELEQALAGTFESIAPSGGMRLTARYVAGAPEEAEAFRTSLARERARDRARGSATTGPHRDDLAISLGGHGVRGMASQGQHRAIVLALELAELRLVAVARGVQPVLLLDDVSSELDRARTAALMQALSQQQGQVVLTTTRPELITTQDGFQVGARLDIRVVQGRILPAQ
jgi:DNA replication and repair protein RecF